MGDKEPPPRKTTLISGDIQITVQDDRLESKDRDAAALDLMKKTGDLTLAFKRNER